MALIENFARNAHTLVRGGDWSGLCSDTANPVKIVKRRVAEFGKREIEHCLSNTPSLVPFTDYECERGGAKEATRWMRE